MPQLRSSFATAYAHSVVCGFVVAGTTTVTDFLYNFLKSKYGVPSAIAEAGYNLVDALQRYQVRNASGQHARLYDINVDHHDRTT